MSSGHSSRTLLKSKVSNEEKNKKSKKQTKKLASPEEGPWKRTIKATVADIRKEKDFYTLYLEDEDIGLGDFEEETMLLDGLHKWLYVTFKDEKTAIKAIDMKHDPDDSNITNVELATSRDFDTYPNLLFLYGYEIHTNDDIHGLKDLISDETGLGIEDIDVHDEPKAVVITFGDCLDITQLTWELKKLNGTEMITAPVYKENSILISGLNNSVPEAHLLRYMKNKKRSGGGEIQSLTYLSEEEAVLTFVKETDLLDVLKLKGQHAIGGTKLEVSNIYPCLTKNYLTKFISDVSPKHLKHSISSAANTLAQKNLSQSQSEKVGIETSFDITENLELKVEELHLLEKSNFLSDLRESNKSVKVIFDHDNAHVIIKGNDKSEIFDAQIKILNICRNDIAEISVNHLAPEQQQFLRNKEVLLKVNSMLTNAYLMCSGPGFKIMYIKSSEDSKKLLGLVDSQIFMHRKSLTSDMVSILQSGKGQTFLSELGVGSNDGDGSPKIELDTGNKSLLIIGPNERVVILQKDIEIFLELNQVFIKEIPFSQGKLQFMKQYMQQEFDSIQLKSGSDVDVQHVSNKFIIKGLKDPVEECFRSLTHLSSTILNDELKLEYFGIQEFLQDEEGSKMLEEVQEKNNCLIIAGSEDSSDLNLPQSVISGSSNLIAKAKIDGAVTLSFIQGSLLDVKVDVIVNPLESSLKLTSSLSKAIIKQGGSTISADLNFSKSYNNLIFKTTSGNLSDVKSILHVKCPVYNESDTAKFRELRESVRSCLEFADNNGCNSIGFPAVGCDKTLKFPPLAACNYLMRAIVDFAESKRTSLRHIYLCDNKEEVVNELIDRFEAVSTNHKIETFTVKNKKEVSHFGASNQTSKTQTDSIKHFQDISVNVMQGEINKQRTDVIVITVDKSLDLTKGKISHTILKEAGDEIQDELKQNYNDGLKANQFAKTSGGNLPCQHIFFACLSRYRQDSESYLEKLVGKMLQEADNLKAKSISIPALGTGKLGYPADVVANVMKEAISKFSKRKTSVQSIKFVVYPADRDVFQSFSSVLPSVDKSSRHDDSNDRKYDRKEKRTTGEVKFGNITLKIKRGDITMERHCDAIVNGIKDNMDLSKSGQVCKALLDVCGKELQDECNNNKDKMAKDGIAVTTAPNMSCKNIIHVSQDQFSRKWDVGITKVLNEADDIGATSLALPALGTGSRHADVQQIKKLIFEAIKRFSKRRNLTVKLIKLVIFDQKTFDVFTEEESSGCGASSSDQQEKYAEKDISEEHILTIYSKNSRDIKVAIENIEKFCKKCYKESIEKDDHFAKKLSIDHIKELKQFGLQKRIKVTHQADTGFFKMEGFSGDDIFQVEKKMQRLILEIIDKHNNALHKSVQSAIIWQYKKGEKWYKFEPIINSELEHKYQQEENDYEFTDENGDKMEIDFRKLKAYLIDENDQEADQYDIKRQDLTKEGEPLPKEWSPMKDDENVKIVELKASAAQYKTVEQHVKNTQGNVQIKKILRIQNKTLYQQYAVKKRDLEHHNPKGHTNELQLFHGTGAVAVPQINENGFNRSYCGVNGTMWGKGVYFHKMASYSVGYAKPPDGNNNHHLYLARVLVGESTPANSSMAVLPIKSGSRPFDSAVHGDIYVIFHDTQAYPEYLIIF
ncbi:protein mono-ADP-ribosyltransferase PARP14-like [Biomphalaria glabrata]|uniref:Poly [ADP-ribose] polymerase n=1 Tax=Biomphalaria glabrata TaxID=6526 RepID=A0A9W2ZGD0_BIOGL|nr:protein mono-ADP-ribosyltransferase PARP14-like [Biomphalaria glabrata]XP_055874108.1 protein mono-ADP-ribosyltransferase PARP14-like [Biomphalaria glabrata]XP_055874109.1 protein mono-ADP-ribosyltransferase PARP14-like [Biomphalaria glabrata]XP_055874110.1 protein mono-ADP-ribosyltransferase PARP14-like [Biomphalaria glabrata]